MLKAAEQLHASQPTLSKTLKALEDELGKKLFIRRQKSYQIRYLAKEIYKLKE